MRKLWWLFFNFIKNLKNMVDLCNNIKSLKILLKFDCKNVFF